MMKRERLLLGLILLSSLVLRLWNLDQIGWGAHYYSAAARSMSASWHNFFYTAFDPAGFISVDKPPISLWLQVAFVKVLGYRPLGVLLPQMLEGVAAVWILYRMVRHRFGSAAGLLAGFFMALTPIWIAVNRTNNTDTCLVLVLLLAGWALLKATEEGRPGLLFLSGTLIGLAFNVKMLAAFIVLPAFIFTYMAYAPAVIWKRIAHLAAAAVIVLAASLPWVLAYEMTPAGDRPYVGGTKTNSMLELVIGHNAANRFSTPWKIENGVNNARKTAAGGSGAESSNIFVRVPPGPLRLADGRLAAQAAWFLPIAAAALLVLIPARRGRSREEKIAVVFWTSWLLVYAVVYSSLRGIFHYYYLAAMAPALSAMAGIGLARLWQKYRGREKGRVLLPAVLIASAVWQIYIESDSLGWNALWTGWQGWLHAALAAGVLLGSAGMMILALRRMRAARFRRLGAVCLGLAVTAISAAPLAWGLSSILPPVYGLLPSADLSRMIPASRIAEARAGQESIRAAREYKLYGFLKKNYGGEKFILATSTAQVAAPVIIGTGKAVMARGGFHGTDPAVTAEKLEEMVRAGEIRFIMLGDLGYGQRIMGGDEAGRPVAEWVRSHGRPVDPELWKTKRMRFDAELYDMRPEKGLNEYPS